jgi:hypothetical protein
MANTQRQVDGDAGFIGIDTRANPATLKSGILQDGRNIRLDLQTLQVRKGLERLLDQANADYIGTVIGAGIYVQSDGSEKIALISYNYGTSTNYLTLFDPITETIGTRYPFPNGRRNITGPIQIIQAVNKLYILRGEATRYIVCDSPSPTQKAENNGSSSSIRVTTILPHGLVVGDEFVIETHHAQWNGPTATNNFVVASVPTTTTFTYNLTVPHSGGQSGYTIQVAKPVLVFNGTAVDVVRQGTIDGTQLGGTTPTSCDFPPTSTAIYHKNRIYCKYSKDEIAVSDYLTDATGNWIFDLTIQALTVNQGDEQDIVGFHPWTRDEILVFKNNSIYTAKFADNTSGPDVILAESYVRTLTFDIGCIAKRSIANVSGYVFFLSKRGVYRLEPQLDTNLLANTAPMSTQIQKYIDRINQRYVQNSVATVYNGRYYLAVPLDNSSYNSHVLVYNLTNQMWESVDTYPANFNADGIVIAKSGSSGVVNRMMFWTRNNGIYLTEEMENDEFGNVTSAPSFERFPYIAATLDSPEIPEGIPLSFYLEPIVYEYATIRGYALTRRFTFNTLHKKRFTAIHTDLDFGSNGTVQTSVITYNPDTSTVLDIVTTQSSEDKTRMFPVRKVSVGVDVELSCLAGRPTIKSVVVEAHQIGRTIKNED